MRETPDTDTRIEEQMSTPLIPMIFDLGARCPACQYDIPPHLLNAPQAVTVRCPQCGHEWPHKAPGSAPAN